MDPKPLSPTRLPSPTRLESTVLHVQSRGDRRAVIRIVERWAEQSEPTLQAKVAQARALFELGAVDRAAARLEDVLGRDDVPVEALVLAGRLCLARGWNDRARPPLQRAAERVDGRRADEIADLLALADRPAAPLPDDPPETAVDLDRLMPVIDQLLRGGAPLRARRLLERLKRFHPDNVDVEDRLWVIEGDLSGGRTSLTALVDRYGPDLPTFVDLPNDDTEHTESISRAAVDLDLDEPSTPFPGLFRDEPEAGAGRDEATEEVTQAALLAPIEPPPSGAAEGGGDTQISRVIRSGENDTIRRADAGLHAPHAPTTHFDLSAWRREMGVADELKMPGDSDLSYAGPSPLGGLEEEDESRVTLLPRSARPASARRVSEAEFELTSEVTGAIELTGAAPSPIKLPPPPGPRGGAALMSAIQHQIRHENAAPLPVRPAKAVERDPAPAPVAAPVAARRTPRRRDPTIPAWAIALVGLSVLFLVLLIALIALNLYGFLV